MGGAQMLLEGALVLLLGVTLFHALRLERALGVLKRDRAVLEELVASFNDSTRQAEIGVERLRAATDGAGRQIAKQIEQAQRLRDDLSFLGDRGEKLAERLESAVRSARMVSDQAAMNGGGMAGAGGSAAGPEVAPGSWGGGSAGTGGLGVVTGGYGAGAEAGEPKLRSEAERDLLRALRAAR
jgi:hypothetical protein